VCYAAQRHSATPTYVRDGDPAGIEGHVERPRSRLAEVLLIAYRVPHRVPVFVTNVQDGLEGQAPKTVVRPKHLRCCCCTRGACNYLPPNIFSTMPWINKFQRSRGPLFCWKGVRQNGHKARLTRERGICQMAAGHDGQSAE